MDKGIIRDCYVRAIIFINGKLDSHDNEWI